jgi:hypothetical protein
MARILERIVVRSVKWQSVFSDVASTCVGGPWGVIKVDLGADSWLASRWPAAAAGSGAQDRNISAIASRLTPKNAIVRAPKRNG